MMFWFDQVVLVGVIGLVSTQLSTVSIHQSKRLNTDYIDIYDTRLGVVCLGQMQGLDASKAVS